MTSNHQKLLSLLALATTLAATAGAQTGQPVPLTKPNPPADDSFLNHVGAAFRFGFNIKPTFKNIGGFSGGNPGPARGGIDHLYDDGYNRVDGNGNDHGPAPFDHATWNWAYLDASQISGTVGVDGFVSMHSTVAAPVDSTPKGCLDDLGFELTYNRELGALKVVRWGVEGAFGYMGFDTRDRQNRATPIHLITDVYALNGVEPTLPGFPTDPNSGPGTFNGPGRLLSDTPSRSIASLGIASITGWRQFEGDLFSGRLGPYMEIPCSERVSVFVSGGLAIVGVDSTFSYYERITTLTPTTVISAGRNKGGDVLFGGYVSGNLAVLISPQISLFGGVQFQSVGTYSHSLKGITAELDLSETVFVVGGVSFAF